MLLDCAEIDWRLEQIGTSTDRLVFIARTQNRYSRHHDLQGEIFAYPSALFLSKIQRILGILNRDSKIL